MPSNIEYRSDIDGLRAVAVLSVILFHINATWVPGGFLGVDIFFVISGYLITLILIKEIVATGTISIQNFYKRRIKRIIPALLFVIIATFIAGFLLFLPNELLSLSTSIIWSLFSAANIYFFSSIDTGYFAEGSNELPLLHLWSLGVEEQFYILWPFAVLILLKHVHSLTKRIFLTCALILISLLWAQSIIVTNHSFAYYMLPTRAWELLAGAFIALIVHSGFRIKRYVSEFIALIGLLAIILCFIFVSESDPVPGLAALPVIIGVSLLILSGASCRTFVGHILSLKILVSIGLVSYSAYLWHWPVLAFLHYALIEIDWIIACCVVLFTFFMATVSYFIIESPLRKNIVSTQKVYLWYFIVPTIIIVAVSTVTILAIKDKNHLIFPWYKLEQSVADTLPASAYKYNCQYSNFNSKVYREDRCIYPEQIAKANAILIGDSNAAHYLGMLRVIAEDYGFSLRNVTQSSCPMVSGGALDWIYPKYTKGCSVYRLYITTEAKKYNTVIIGLNGPDYLHKKKFKKHFDQTIRELSGSVKNIILLGKPPTFTKYNKGCEMRAIRLNNLNCSRRFNNIQKDHKSNQYLSNIANRYKNVSYFDIRSLLCHKGRCSPYLDGSPIYFNAGHLSMKGSEKIGQKLIQERNKILSPFNVLRNLK